MFSTARLAPKKKKSFAGWRKTCSRMQNIVLFFVVVIGSLCFLCFPTRGCGKMSFSHSCSVVFRSNYIYENSDVYNRALQFVLFCASFAVVICSLCLFCAFLWS